MCEQFHRLPHEYTQWLMDGDIPPEVTRLDWHAFNVAAAAFLAKAHKDAQDEAMRNAKKGATTRSRDSRGRFRHADTEERVTVAENPFAPGATLMIPDSAFSDGPDGGGASSFMTAN